MSWRRRIEAKVDALLHTLLTETKIMATIADIINDLNTNTNGVAARLDALIKAGTLPDGSLVASADQVAELQAVSDHLKQLGADPTRPVPPAFPADHAAATTSPAAVQPAQVVTQPLGTTVPGVALSTDPTS